LGDSGAADALASAAEFFKRQPALFYRGRQSKAPRRVEQLQLGANLLPVLGIRWSVHGWLALGAAWGIGSPSARHDTCSVCEIERRPRGASQHKAAPTSVSGQ